MTTVVFRGLLVVVLTNLASSHFTPVSGGEVTTTRTEKEDSAEKAIWGLILARPFFLTSPPSLTFQMKVPTLPSTAGYRAVVDDNDNFQESSSYFPSSPDTPAPKFTPYVSARVLSNLREYFHQVKENLMALRMREFLTRNSLQVIPSRHPKTGVKATKSKNSPFETTSPTINNNNYYLDGTSEEEVEAEPLKNVKSPLSHYSKVYYDPAWQKTNLGLGRRKRMSRK